MSSRRGGLVRLTQRGRELAQGAQSDIHEFLLVHNLPRGQRGVFTGEQQYLALEKDGLLAGVGGESLVEKR